MLLLLNEHIPPTSQIPLSFTLMYWSSSPSTCIRSYAFKGFASSYASIIYNLADMLCHAMLGNFCGISKKPQPPTADVKPVL
jgi:hypothetical protein